MPQRSQMFPRNNLSYAKLVDIQMMVRTGGRNRTREEFRGLLPKLTLAITDNPATRAGLFLRTFVKNGARAVQRF